MKFPVRLFIQRHEGRRYTVHAPLFPAIAAYGPTLEECKIEIAESLERFLSELDSEHLHRFQMPNQQRLEQVTVELRPTDRHGKRRRDTLRLTLSLLLTTTDQEQTLVSVPLLRHPPLAFYVAAHDDLLEIARLELIQYFHGETLEDLLEYRAARHESLDVLEVEFRPKKAADRREAIEEDRFWALKASGINLTAQAAEGQLRRAYRRDEEVRTVLAAIAGERRPSIMLIGPAGVGKTVIAHEVARRIKLKECPETLFDRQVWAVSGESILAGCQFIGQWQEKLGDIVQEVRKKRIILFVEDITSLTESGRHSKGDDNLADFLKPHIQSGDVVLIGAVTPDRLRRAEQLTPGFVAQLRSLEIAPPGESDNLSILSSLAREMERGEELRIEPSALEAAIELTNRYLPYRAQPGKAIALVEQIVADALRQRSSGRALVTRRELIAGFTRQSGLPEFLLADSMTLDLDAVQAHFADRIVGQSEAVAAMVDLIAMVKAGLNDPGKPLGVYLFIGPTGVGKTQLAKALAGYLFGDEKRLIRFDMSEYSDPAAIRRLIGTPGMGREGSEGELTRLVRAQPFCVLLLDEFEKADPQIFDVFLQVLGEGRLSDATGATTSFQNAIVIMTSNLGASAREQRGLGLGSSMSERIEREPQPSALSSQPSYWQRRVEQHFRPEFVNRIDRIVAFKALDEQAMRRIARREIGDVLLREGFVRRNVLVEVEDNVIDLLIERGFTATYGARPLKRSIEQLIVLPLARHLAVRAKPGGDLLRLRRAGDEVILSAINTAGDRGAEVLVEGGTRRRADDRTLAEGFAELRRKLDAWNERDSLRAMRDERASSLAATNKPTFWDDGEAARRTLARFYVLDRMLKRLQQLTDRAAYLEELSGLVHRQRDPRYRAELAESYGDLERDVAFLEVELLCAHLEDNHRAVLRIRRVGTAGDEEGETWINRLAAIYLRWATRKGYEVGLFALEPLPDAAARGEGMLARHYPYRWQAIDCSNPDDALKTLARSNPAELAISLEGTNVYGFMKGEAGLHRRNEKRASGERVQRLAEIQVSAIGEDAPDLWLDKLLLARAMDERERATLTKKQLAALPTAPDPALVRVYQLEGERLVRDPRTLVKIGAVAAVLDGAIDEFILAYLREAETRPA